MFATLSRFRRQIAVLTALAMVASVLVAVPAVAADDPKMDYPATFDACMGVPASDFEDVPANHANAGDIDCIAYYNITRGTSMTTYSPLMSVTREHMALFLTRLAGLVGIDMASDPDDAGFTDIGELSAESQTAINQLADLGVTQGTSTTTYSPDDSVKRGHMALFIARLMDEMAVMDDGDDSTDPFGYTPSDVKDTEDDAGDPDKVVGSPFGDIDSQTKEAYDAITNLWELGVASGVNATHYNPAANITRADMAGFMAGVLDHSNARPAGVTIQASKTSGFDAIDATVAVSYRDDSFAPMVDVSIKTFFSGNDGADEGVGEFTEDGGCEMPADCAWTNDESLSDDSGNLYVEGGAANGTKNTYYAWMGDADADDNDFNVDKDHASVTLSSTRDAVNLKVTSDISTNSTGDNTVDIDATSSVTHTVQLVDENGDPVAKSGVEISVMWVQDVADDGTGNDPAAVTVYPAPAPLETDDDGQATFTTSGPKSNKGSTDVARTDTLTFTSDVDGANGVGNPATTVGDPAENVAKTIEWVDTDPVLTAGEGSAPDYAVMNTADEVSVRASVTFYDQYGNTIGKGNSVLITIGAGDNSTSRRTVSSRGVASWRRTGVDATINENVPVTYTEIQDSDDEVITTAPTVDPTPVVAVRHAPDDSSALAANITALYADDDRFHIAGLLYTYDSDDVFIDDTDNGAMVVDMAKFETLLGAKITGTPTTPAEVQVVSYDDDGSSIFRVGTAAAP
ncbi:MAG: S-layer homology domain-containing protein [Acidimicrobiia bacterium]|nr:S-layer homology domain-containing protein [Acidimicrobiia bacterium]